MTWRRREGEILKGVDAEFEDMWGPEGGSVRHDFDRNENPYGSSSDEHYMQFRAHATKTERELENLRAEVAALRTLR